MHSNADKSLLLSVAVPENEPFPMKRNNNAAAAKNTLQSQEKMTTILNLDHP